MMKLISALEFCFFVGLAVAEYAWAPQKEYEYHYRGRLMTGIPELAPQVAGLVVSAKVIVQAKDANNLYVQAKDVAIHKVNIDLRSDRIEDIPVSSSVPSDMIQILESPVIMNMKNGAVESVVASSQEQTWSLNWKKALVSVLHVNLANAEIDVSENLISREAGPSGYHKVMEAGMNGECETVYEMAPLSRQLVVENPEWVAVPEACTGGQHLEIIKTKNFDNCRKRPIFHRIAPGTVPCEHGTAGCEGLWTRAAVTRYIACGTHSNFAIQKVYSTGEIAVNIFGYKTEKVITKNDQNLTLSAMRTISSPIADPMSPITHTSLMFEMPVRNPQRSHHQPAYDNWVVQDTEIPSLRAPPNALVSELGAHIEAVKKMSPSDIKNKIKRLLDEVAREIEAGENVADKNTAGKVIAISKAMTLLDLDEARSLFTEAADIVSSADQRQEIKRNIFLDALVMSGTNPAIMLVKELVLTRKVVGEHAIQTIMTLAKHIKTPTVELLKHIFEIASSDVAASDHQMKATTALIFSNLVNHACIRREIKKDMYPEELYGELCTAATPEIIQTFIPYFKRQLEDASDVTTANLYLRVLGNFGHESVLSAILPYVEGKALRSGKAPNVHIRSVALFSLARIAMTDPRKVIPIVASVINNLAEDHEVRMAAIALLPHIDPPLAHWEKLALRTWFEPNRQVAAFIHTTLATLAESKDHLYAEIAAKAAMVLPLAKPVLVGAQYSRNFYVSDFLKTMQLGVAVHLALINGHDSILPHNMLYRQIQRGAALHANTVFANIFGYGIENLVQQLYKEIAGPGHYKLEEDIRHSSISLDNIKNTLNIQPRVQMEPEGSAYVKILDLVDRLFVFDKDTVNTLAQGVAAAASQLRNGVPINYQKAVSMADAELVVPSEMGLPLVFSVHMPLLVSVRGHAQMTGASDITADIKPVVNWKMIGQVSMVCPYTSELITVGVDRHMMINTPVKGHIRADLHAGKVAIGVTPVAYGAQHEMVHIQTKPFIAFKSIMDFTPAAIAPQIQLIKRQEQPVAKEIDFGNDLLGIRFHMIHKADLPMSDLSAIYREIREYSPMALIHFCWTKASLHMSEYTVAFDASNSATKEIEAEIAIGKAIKHQSASSHPVMDVDSSIREDMKKVLDEIDSGTVITAGAVLKLKGRNNRNYKVAASVGMGNAGLKQKIRITIDRDPAGSYDSTQFKMCVDGESHFPDVPFLDRQELLSASGVKATIAARVGFGNTCEDSRIYIKGEMIRNEEMVQFAKTSPEAKICEQEERHGIRASHHCDLAKVQAAALNEYDITVQCHRELPASVINAANMAEITLKSILLPYLSEEAASVHNPEQQVRVQIKSHPAKAAATISVSKPRVNTVFRDVRIPAGVSRVVGVNTRYSIVQQVLDQVAAGSFYPVCVLQQNAVRTFDLVKYNYDMNDCHHVLMKDCSGPRNKKIAVLAKNVSGKKAVLVILHDTKIEVVPESGYFTKTTMAIQVDDRKVGVQQARPVAVKTSQGDVVAEIIQTADKAIKIMTPLHHVDVITDGQAVVIKASHLYRGRVCGLCGDMNGEATADLRSPGQCVLSSPHLAGVSYMLQGAGCSRMPHEDERKLQQEQQRCIRAEVVPTPVSPMASRSDVACTKFRHIVQMIDGRTCVSKIQVPECSEHCRPSQQVVKQVNFHCLQRSSLQAESILKKVEQGLEVEELRYHPTQETRSFYVPVSCAA